MDEIDIEAFFNNIRNDINSIRVKLEEMKRTRKSLIKKIGNIKLSIRGGDRVISLQHHAGLEECNYYVSYYINEQKIILSELKKKLLVCDIERDLELCRFRELHRQLDKFGVPFDPVAKQRKMEILGIKKSRSSFLKNLLK
jgi:hypothetical protein